MKFRIDKAKFQHQTLKLAFFPCFRSSLHLPVLSLQCQIRLAEINHKAFPSTAVFPLPLSLHFFKHCDKKKMAEVRWLTSAEHPLNCQHVRFWPSVFMSGNAKIQASMLGKLQSKKNDFFKHTLWLAKAPLRCVFNSIGGERKAREKRRNKTRLKEEEMFSTSPLHDLRQVGQRFWRANWGPRAQVLSEASPRVCVRAFDLSF